MKPLGRGTAIGLMLLAPLLWSSAGVVTRHIERAPAFEQVFWRSLVACLFVAGVLLFQGKSPLRAARATGWAGAVSAAMWGAMFTAFVIALSMTTTANALVMQSMSPILTAMLALALLREPVALHTWIAAVAAAAGIAWMFHDGMGSGHLAGMLVASIIPVGSAINVVTLRAAGARVDLVPAVMLGGAVSTLIALPLAFPFQASANDLLLLAFLGIFQLGLPCMLLVLASRVLPAPEIALLGLLEIILGPLWAWLGAGEQPAQATLIGGAVVLGALALNELGGLRRSGELRA